MLNMHILSNCLELGQFSTSILQVVLIVGQLIYSPFQHLAQKSFVSWKSHNISIIRFHKKLLPTPQELSTLDGYYFHFFTSFFQLTKNLTIWHCHHLTGKRTLFIPASSRHRRYRVPVIGQSSSCNANFRFLLESDCCAQMSRSYTNA